MALANQRSAATARHQQAQASIKEAINSKGV